MKFAILFSLLGVLFAVFAAQTAVDYTSASLALAYHALTYLLVGAAYAFRRPQWFRKSSAGVRPWYVWLPFGPYLIMAKLFVWLEGIFTPEAHYHEIAPGLYLGRYPDRKALPPDVTIVVDLCAEIPRVPAQKVGVSTRYLATPTLDGTAPPLETLKQTVATICECATGATLIHCASGHGRSATVMGCVLIKKGLADSAETALALMKQGRPRVSLQKEQFEMIKTFAAQAN